MKGLLLSLAAVNVGKTEDLLLLLLPILFVVVLLLLWLVLFIRHRKDRKDE